MKIRGRFSLQSLPLCMGALLALPGCVVNPGGPGGGPGPNGPEGSLAFSVAQGSPAPLPGTVLAVADWTGDGKPDAAMIGSLGIGVLLNQGGGAFQTGISVALGGDPAYAATGDFNGDGKADLAVADAAAGTISAFAGQGDGTFGPPQTLQAGMFPQALLARDLNGDGKTDLVVAASSGHAVLVFLFGAAQAQSYAATLPTALASADFNGDGKPDLAVGEAPNAHSFFRILLNQGNGTFMPGAMLDIGGPELQTLAAGDLNGDGKADVAVHAGYAKAAIFLGTGAGTFTAMGSADLSQDPVAGLKQLAIADFNGGGRPDLGALVVPGAGPAFLSVALGRGDGTFAGPVNFGQFNTSSVDRDSMAAADLSGDGKPDFAVTDGNQLDVFLNQSH